MAPKSDLKPAAHPGAAVAAIGGMSLVLAIAVQLMGFTQRIDSVFAGWMANTGLEGKARETPELWAWAWTIVAVFGLAAAMLASRRNWRRAVLWISGLVLTLGWVPVLALASYGPAVTMPFVALVWCGLWTMIYATRHQEPGEEEAA